MSTRLTTAQRTKFFGAHGDQRQHITVTTPWGIKTRCHRLLVAVFLEACTEAAKLAWKPQRIDSYNDRPIRGTDDEWSLHSWALAWDFFATPPNVSPPGGVWKPDNPVPVGFATCFTRRGFTWGAGFSRVDWPHIEWAGTPPKAQPTVTASTPVVTASQGTVVLTENRTIVGPTTEVHGVRLETIPVSWERLDAQGRGYVDVPVPRERITGILPQGSNPEKDQPPYWDPIITAVNGLGSLTRITLAGTPGHGGMIYVQVLRDE